MLLITGQQDHDAGTALGLVARTRPIGRVDQVGDDQANRKVGTDDTVMGNGFGLGGGPLAVKAERSSWGKVSWGSGPC